MENKIYDKKSADIAWCPGCGNFVILDIIKQALTELSISPQNLVVTSGIGQAPKTPQYFQTNMFNGLHGRAVPVASAVKAANPELTVIAEGGDGDMYGEGGNHFLHGIRRNSDILHIVHNNMVYGLTKGQASPTSQTGFVTPVQVDGVSQEPVNPIAVAIAQNATFVARANCGDKKQAVSIVKAAITHKGYALVDLFQACVTFNKVNTYKWFKENTRNLDESYDPTDRVAAFATAIESAPFALGVIYKQDKPSFEENLFAYREDKTPIFKREVNLEKLQNIIESKRKL